ncbi:unnamed protein product [Diplocarpon coronariae]
MFPNNNPLVAASTNIRQRWVSGLAFYARRLRQYGSAAFAPQIATTLPLYFPTPRDGLPLKLGGGASHVSLQTESCVVVRG